MTITDLASDLVVKPISQRCLREASRRLLDVRARRKGWRTRNQNEHSREKFRRERRRDGEESLTNKKKESVSGSILTQFGLGSLLILCSQGRKKNNNQNGEVSFHPFEKARSKGALITSQI